MVTLHKPEVEYLGVKDRFFNYTLGGIAQYKAEIAILCDNGYTATEHDVTDREGNALTVAALYRLGAVVKAYEL